MVGLTPCCSRSEKCGVSAVSVGPVATVRAAKGIGRGGASPAAIVVCISRSSASLGSESSIALTAADSGVTPAPAASGSVVTSRYLLYNIGLTKHIQLCNRHNGRT